jgi:hypothetical protein
MLCLACASGAAAAANPELLDIEPDILAKIAREKLKAQQERSKGDKEMERGRARERAACGNVDIGNVIGGRHPGFQPRNVTVVVTGDVINAFNKCR